MRLQKNFPNEEVITITIHTTKRDIIISIPEEVEFVSNLCMTGKHPFEISGLYTNLYVLGDRNGQS